MTTPAEARLARDAGAHALVVQGVEAGGHRGGFDDAAGPDPRPARRAAAGRGGVDLPLVATGGLATGRSIAAVLAAGAAAAQLGTALMRTPEAGTSPAHREALASGRADRAHARVHGPHRARRRQPLPARAHGRRSRRLPRGPPPDRAAADAAREQGDADGFHLWAGQAHALAEELPAGELVRRLADDASAALADAARRPALRAPTPESFDRRTCVHGVATPSCGCRYRATAGALGPPFTHPALTPGASPHCPASSPQGEPSPQPRSPRHRPRRRRRHRRYRRRLHRLVGQPEQHVHGRHDDHVQQATTPPDLQRFGPEAGRSDPERHRRHRETGSPAAPFVLSKGTVVDTISTGPISTMLNLKVVDCGLYVGAVAPSCDVADPTI